MLEQEKLDNVMIEMDGTDNKCKPRPHHAGVFLRRRGGEHGRMYAPRDRFCLASQLSSGPILFWEYRWPSARPVLRRKTSPCTGTLLIWQETQTWSFRFQ